MECAEFVELVTDFFDRALRPADEARFVEHLALCEGCEHHLAQVRQTVTALGGLDAGPALTAATRETLLSAFRDFHRAG